MEELIRELQQAQDDFALALTARTWQECRNQLARAKASLNFALSLAEDLQRTRQAQRQGE